MTDLRLTKTQGSKPIYMTTAVLDCSSTSWGRLSSLIMWSIPEGLELSSLCMSHAELLLSLVSSLSWLKLDTCTCMQHACMLVLL